MNANSLPKNIVLIGMPAVGKSTIGVLLAERIRFSYLDTDIYLQVNEGRRLYEIIAADGMDGFCDIEEKNILSLTCRSHVIATGGSVVYREAAMAHLKSMGALIHMDVSPDELKRRIGNIDQRGVVHSGGQTLADLYAERHPLYRRYEDIFIDCSKKSPEAVVEEITSQILV